jgi:hypothetical protein
MGSKDRIFIDGRTAVHVGSKGRVDAWQMYRQGSTVTPRLNVSKTADAVSTSTTVSFFDCPAITIAAHIANSHGDADTEGGLLNGGLKSEATFFKTGSSQLLIEGNEAVRAFDLCEPNRGNGPLMPIMQAGGAPLGSTLEHINLSVHEADAISKKGLIHLGLEACQPDNRYGYAAVLSEDRGSPQAVLIDPIPIGDRQTSQSTVPLELHESIPVGTPVTVWLLETDKVPAYTQKDREAWPALGKNWASYCPVPLSPLPIETQLKSREKIINVACICVYPVREYQQENSEKSWKLLPSGWLYLFMEGYLWREFKITTVSQGMPLYHFSEVNLITQQGRHWREASTQGRMDTILLPREIQGKGVSMGVAFSETQWPWARVISAGGMHPVDPRVLAHRQQSLSDSSFAQSPDDKTLVQPIVEYPTATLHTEAASPYSVYEGPLLIVPV